MVRLLLVFSICEGMAEVAVLAKGGWYFVQVRWAAETA
jgi:hypothetical protein